VDAGFAAKAGIAVGVKTDDYAGPAGATGEVRAAREPVTLRIDGQALTPVPAEVYDIYAYASTSRPSEEESLTGGYLGCDVMLSSRAVIDFGSGLLFLRLPEPH
jgi:hypothetical protein